MNRHLVLNFLFIFLTCSLGQAQSSGLEGAKKKTASIYTDRIVTLFGDSSYKLALHIFDIANDEEDTKNATLIFTKQEKDNVRVFFRDSLFCMYPEISFQDFNNDKIKDVLIFYFTGGRANPTYHLYLTDAKNRKLMRVKGFEELPNPDLDTTNNIIVSIALSGTNHYSFYRINKGNKLTNLGNDFFENL